MFSTYGPKPLPRNSSTHSLGLNLYFYPSLSRHQACHTVSFTALVATSVTQSLVVCLCGTGLRFLMICRFRWELCDGKPAMKSQRLTDSPRHSRQTA